MNRRNFLKSVASLPVASTIPSLPFEDTQDQDEVEGMSGVWKRRTDTGVLLTSDGDQEYAEYGEWRRAVVSATSEYSLRHTVNLFDFDLISMQSDDTRWRSHWCHDCGLEMTIRRDTEADEEEYSMVVTHVDEEWEEHRQYSSSAQITIAQRAKEERDKYL